MQKIVDKRSRLVAAATELSYAHGFGNVSLADVAARAEVPVGNVYYYFKTKDSIAEAVIARRCEEFEQMRTQCDIAPTPRERLRAFVSMTAGNREALARSGCPVGTLCAEFGKREAPLTNTASEPFRRLLVWMEDQFELLGQRDTKRTLALHLLAALQGVSLLANCFRDPALVETEASFLHSWIDTLAEEKA